MLTSSWQAFLPGTSNETHHALPQPLIVRGLDGVHLQLVEVSTKLVFHLHPSEVLKDTAYDT